MNFGHEKAKNGTAPIGDCSQTANNFFLGKLEREKQLAHHHTQLARDIA